MTIQKDVRVVLTISRQWSDLLPKDVIPPPHLGQRKQKIHRSKPLVPSQIIYSALKVCQEYLENLEHRDIDKNLETPQTLTQEQWAEFINSYYLVAQWVCISVRLWESICWGKMPFRISTALLYLLPRSVVEHRWRGVNIWLVPARPCCRDLKRLAHSWA